MKLFSAAALAAACLFPGTTAASDKIDTQLSCLTLVAYLDNEHLFTDVAGAFFEGVLQSFLAGTAGDNQLELVWAFMDACIAQPDDTIEKAMLSAREAFNDPG